MENSNGAIDLTIACECLTGKLSVSSNSETCPSDRQYPWPAHSKKKFKPTKSTNWLHTNPLTYVAFFNSLSLLFSWAIASDHANRQLFARRLVLLNESRRKLQQHLHTNVNHHYLSAKPAWAFNMFRPDSFVGTMQCKQWLVYIVPVLELTSWLKLTKTNCSMLDVDTTVFSWAVPLSQIQCKLDYPNYMYLGPGKNT